MTLKHQTYIFFQNRAQLSSQISTLSHDDNLFRPGTAIKPHTYSIKPLLDLLTIELDWCHIMCISYPGQLQRPGIERELSLGCAFTYQPAEFGCRPGWQMGLAQQGESGGQAGGRGG